MGMKCGWEMHWGIEICGAHRISLPNMVKQQRTKHDPSYWEYVNALHSDQNRNSSVKCCASSSKQPKHMDCVK